MPRTTTTTNGTNGKVETLQELHARLVKEYASGTVKGAQLARISKSIGDAEYAMELADLEYRAWVKPSAYRQSWTLTEDELRQRYVKASALANDPAKRESIRDRASKDAESLLEQSRRRGVTLPEPTPTA